jgi:hypothetical protein
VRDIYVYADETGDLTMDAPKGASRYFGFGTAVFVGDHGRQLWEGLELRCRLERDGVQLPAGLHAKNDSRATWSEVFTLIRQQALRFDATLLLKERASASIKTEGPIALYRTAWFLHFRHVVQQISEPGDRLYVIAGSLQTSRKRDAIRLALKEVCAQVGTGRDIVPCIWDAASAWGIQVADYALWAVQRLVEQELESAWFERCIKPTLRSMLRPWEQA